MSVESSKPYYKIVQIKPTDYTHVSEALEIYNLSLGDGYFTRSLLLEYVQNPQSSVALGAIVQNRLVGVITGGFLSNEQTQDYRSDLSEVGDILTDHKIGLIKSVAIGENFRQQGIGTNLTLRTLERFRQLGCTASLAESWDYDRPYSSRKMFESLQFTKLLRVSDRWTQDSIDRKYECPFDGNPCHCAAIFFFKEI